ncbi:MAG: AAA family ATPase [Anaerolineae bacterium]
MSANSNPYVVDQPVESPDLFVGRSDILSWLQDSLDVGVRVLAICGARGMGKSSVLAQLRHHLIGPYLVLRVPCRELAGEPLPGLLFRVAEAIAHDLVSRYGLEFPSPLREEFIEDVSALAGPFWAHLRQATAAKVPVLLLDDFEFLAERVAPEWLKEFLDYLDRLLQRDTRLRLVFTALDPGQLRASHPALFARLLWRNLPALNRQEALRLVRGPVAGAMEYEYEAVDRILELSSRRPRYIQLLCRGLTERAGGRGYVGTGDVDQVALELASGQIPEFEALWEGLSSAERITLSALAELRGTHGLATRQDLMRVLRNAGLLPPAPELAQVMEQLVEKGALERLGAMSFQFSVYLMRTWALAKHPLPQVLEKEKWPRAAPKQGPSQRSRVLLALATLAVVALFAWSAWFKEERGAPGPVATAPATPPSTAPRVEGTAAKSPAPTPTTPLKSTEPGQIPQPAPSPLPLPAVPTRGYVFVRSLPAIAYMSRAKDEPWRVWTMTSDGQTRFPITDGRADDSSPVWAPDGSELLFVSQRDGNREIYRISLDAALAGEPPTNLTRNRADDWTPSWSPDGTEIAFSSNRNGNWDIYVMRADGSDPVRLTDDPESDISPDWSPDGQRIVFASKRSGNWDLYIMNRDGSGLVQITDHPASDLSPDWSPDGSRIAFETTRDGDAEVYIMWADGYDTYNLTQDPTANDHWPTWSPDGQRIAFCSNREKNWEIYTLDIEGYSLINLTNSPETNDQGPAWRP